MKQRTIKTTLAALALLTTLWLPAAAASRTSSGDSGVWLRVEIKEDGRDRPNVTVNMPLSLIEVVIDNIEPARVVKEIKSEKGIDIAKIWKQMRDMDIDEFITIDKDDAKVKVYKDHDFFKITVHEESGEGTDADLRIPFGFMDYLLDADRDKFDFQEMVNSLKGHLPLTLVEATHEDGSIKVWLEEK